MRPLRLADTHCHLTAEAFDADREAVLARAAAAGVESCLLVAVDAPSSRDVSALAATRPGVLHATAGIHPNEPTVDDPAAWAEVVRILDAGGVCALGESGLDAFQRRTSRDAQRAGLRWHLRAALDRDLPVVLHCRDAFADLGDVLDDFAGAPLRGVVHCFTGTRDELDRVLAAGLHVGIGGVVTFRANEALRRTAAAIPGERLLLETDAPWLAPVPHRGARNEPAFVRHVAEVLAAARDEDVHVLAARCADNAAALFGWTAGAA